MKSKISKHIASAALCILIFNSIYGCHGSEIDNTIIYSYVNPNDSAIFRSLLDSNGLNRIKIGLHCLTDRNGYINSIHLNGLNIDSFYFTQESKNLNYLTTFDIMTNNLTEVPRGISMMRQLRSILLSSNKISKLSNELLTLDSLEGLSIGYCLFDSISTGISSLTSLKIFDARWDSLTTLPLELIRLPKLADTNMSNNQNVVVYYNKICNPTPELDTFLAKFQSDWRTYQRCP